MELDRKSPQSCMQGRRRAVGQLLPCQEEGAPLAAQLSGHTPREKEGSSQSEDGRHQTAEQLSSH